MNNIIHDRINAYLASTPHILQSFERLSPSHKKEYISWIAEAKKETTREKRLAQMKEMLAMKKS